MDRKNYEVREVPLDEILPMRDMFLHEMHCQFVHNAFHARGWSDSYLLSLDGRPVGHASVGGVRGEPKDTVFEFYVLSHARTEAFGLFQELLKTRAPRFIEAQTNDKCLTLMAYEFATDIKANTMLFADAKTTNLSIPGVTFRLVNEADKLQLPPEERDDCDDWVLEADREVVGSGGVLFHYNVPYGDVYMHVKEPYRRRGYGSYLVQELKRVCYEIGRVPAARCNAENKKSRATLMRAGFEPCGMILIGRVKEQFYA